jgi:sugar phosphate isomerase/epimerase
MNKRCPPAINPVFLTSSPDNWPLEDLASMGYRGLELTPLGLSRGPLEEADDLGMGLLSVNALPVLTRYLSGSLSDAIEWRRRKTLDGIAQVLEIMRTRDIPHLIVAPCKLAEIHQTEEEARDLLISSIVEIGELGPTSILLESGPYRLFQSSSEISSIIDDVDMKNVGAALDVGHTMMAGEDPSDSANVLGDRLRYLQVRDIDLTEGKPPMDHHLPLGRGSVDIGRIVDLIDVFPWSITVCAPESPLVAARSALKLLGFGT